METIHEPNPAATPETAPRRAETASERNPPRAIAAMAEPSPQAQGVASALISGRSWTVTAQPSARSAAIANIATAGAASFCARFSSMNHAAARAKAGRSGSV